MNKQKQYIPSESIEPNSELLERFWGKVEKKAPNECWEWTGSTTPYGTISIKGRSKRAHRVSYMLEHGEIAENMIIMHTCDNPPCVNPRHLRMGTHQDNIRDMHNKGRAAYNYMNASRSHGSEHNSAKLNEKDVLEIRADIRQYKIIAKDYNVSPVTISHIMGRKTWKHI